jgi:glyoxylase-like metal-dependent hydrolase (beta-lactamase superfamily II)
VDQELADGDLLDTGNANLHVQILHTPGHTPGHICLFEERSGTLLAGDLVATDSTILIHPDDGDLETYMQSLEKVLLLPVRSLIPAHGAPVERGQDLLARTLSHRRERLKQIAALVRSKTVDAKDSEQIARTLYKDSVPESLMHLAVLSVLSSLRWLDERGFRVSF